MSNSLEKTGYRKIIDRLKHAREKRDMTQQMLADELKKPQSYIAKIEGYERRLDVFEFVELAKALKVKTETILK